MLLKIILTMSNFIITHNEKKVSHTFFKKVNEELMGFNQSEVKDLIEILRLNLLYEKPMNYHLIDDNYAFPSPNSNNAVTLLIDLNRRVIVKSADNIHPENSITIVDIKEM